MNRRNFLQLAALAVAGQAAERVWPFRVYSIPKKIVAACGPCLTTEIFRRSVKRIMEAGGRPKELFVPLRAREKFYQSDIIMDAVPYSLMQYYQSVPQSIGLLCGLDRIQFTPLTKLIPPSPTESPAW